MICNRSTGNRKLLLRAGLLTVAFMAIIASQINLPSGMAVGRKGPVFDIVPNLAESTLSAIPQKGETFYLEGDIYRFKDVKQDTCELLPTAVLLGTWRAWGTVANDGRLVLHQTLSFDRPDATPLNGTIEVQGVSGLVAPNGDVTFVPNTNKTTGPSEVQSVVGGSGRFDSLNGEAVIRPYCNPTIAGTNPFRFDRAFCLGVE
jgi:hypothetical protein